MTDVEKARAILAKYGKELLDPWDGYKMFWHPWHSRFKAFAMQYEGHDSYISRIIQIEAVKDEWEWAQRYQCFRPVLGVLPDELVKVSADYFKACAAYDKVSADYFKACADLDKARADYDKALADYASDIDALWRVECADIVHLWDENKKELVFTGGAQ